MSDAFLTPEGRTAITHEVEGYRESEIDGSSDDTLEDWIQGIADAVLTHWPTKENHE